MGILGAGVGAAHARAYRALPERFEIAAVCDLDGARAEAVAAGAPALTHADALLEREIDLVDVCLPPALHVPMSVRAIEAGHHVICEKPIARSLDEMDALEAAQARAGRQVFPVFQYRYGPAAAQLGALAREGLLGDPMTAALETHWSRGAAYYAEPWRGTWAGEAGGAIAGHAIHAHDLLCQYMGPVASVFAYLATRANPIETEDTAAIAFEMASGALATSSVTLGAGTDTTRLRFVFERLTATSGTSPYAPMTDAWRFEPRDRADAPAVEAALRSATPARSGFEGFLEAVADALQGAAGDAVTLADGRRSIELATAIYASARLAERVTLPLDACIPLRSGWAP